MTEEDLASYLMYPRVWMDYAGDRIQYGDVSILPTPVFFYGSRARRSASTSSAVRR